MYTLTLQLHAQGKWQDAMALNFAEPEKGFLSACQYGYTSAYVGTNLDAYESTFDKAVSVRLPVDFDPQHGKKAPAFLHDIAPSGAAKRFLLRHMGREKPEGLADDLFLLARSQLLAPLVDPQQAFERLRQDARRLMALPDLLVGLPDAVMNHPAIALKNLEQRMKGWGLL